MKGAHVCEEARDCDCPWDARPAWIRGRRGDISSDGNCLPLEDSHKQGSLIHQECPFRAPVGALSGDRRDLVTIPQSHRICSASRVVSKGRDVSLAPGGESKPCRQVYPAWIRYQCPSFLPEGYRYRRARILHREVAHTYELFPSLSRYQLVHHSAKERR